MKRSELVKKLRQSMIDKTNKHGYIDINEVIISEVLQDLEQLVLITYEPEDQNEDNV